MTRWFNRVARGGRAWSVSASGASLVGLSAAGHLLARQAHHGRVFLPHPELRPVKEAIHDVPGPLDPVIDQLGRALPRGEKQRGRLTGGEGLGKLDEGFLPVVKDPGGRPAWMGWGVDAVAKVELGGIAGERGHGLLLLG